MKFSIGHRLFVAVLLSTIAVGVVGLELARWNLLDNFAPRTVDANASNVGDLADALTAQYRVHADWSFLPADSAQRKIWLREEYRRLRLDRNASSGAEAASQNLDYRIGLVDKDSRYLAGVIANPIIVAFASIDRFARPLVVNHDTVGYLVVAKPQNPDDTLAVAFLIDQQANLLIVAIAGVLLSALAAALLAVHFRRAIRELVAGARKLESGRLESRIALQRSDELGELAEAFNRLAARLDAAEGIRRQWVADTSHELRTPLSVLRAQMEGLQDGVRLATPENVALMLRQVHSLTKLVDELYELACADIGQLHCDPAPCEIWSIVSETFDGFAEKFRAAGLRATISKAPARSTVLCDGEQMRRVITNLLENSARYTSAGGCVAVSGKVTSGELRIGVEDSAPGIAEPLLTRLGERFFRVEGSRNRRFGGAGLGLALCRQILDLHGGHLRFEQSSLGGLRAIVVLPLDNE